MATAAASRVQRCSKHPRSIAPWRCVGCGLQLCEECAYIHQVGPAQVIACSSCGEMAAELKVHRSTTSLLQRIPRAMARPLNRNSLFTMAAAAAVVGIMGWLTVHTIGPLVLFSFIMTMGVFWGYLLLVIRSASQSADGDLEPAELTDFFQDLLGPAMKGTLATAVVWGPAGAFMFLRPGGVPGALQSPLFWLIVLAGVLYAPMALMVAAAGGSVLQMLNPVAVVWQAVRLGRDYLMALAAMVPVAGAYVALSVLAWALRKIPFPPLLPAWLGETLTLYPPTVGAIILGQLLYVRGDAIEYGRAEDYLEPVAPGATPRGPPFRRPGASAVEVAELVEPARGDEPLVAGTGGDLGAALAACVQREDLDGALQLYVQVQDGERWSLPGEVHVAVGQRAAAKGDYALAVKALRQVAQNDVDPVAPKACVILARLYGERLGDLATAEKLYRHVIARYPDTPAAQFARTKLGVQA